MIVILLVLVVIATLLIHVGLYCGLNTVIDMESIFYVYTTISLVIVIY